MPLTKFTHVLLELVFKIEYHFKTLLPRSKLLPKLSQCTYYVKLNFNSLCHFARQSYTDAIACCGSTPPVFENE